MTIKEATDILRRHNLWRRYVGPIGEGPDSVHPIELGIAIDTLLADSLTWQDVKRIVNIADDLLEANPHPASEEEFNLQHTKD